MKIKGEILPVILGPTASGKTNLAVALANELNGEVISADSRQVYREMDIGTGKDIEEYSIGKKKITYHLIDICDPGEKYNINTFYKDFVHNAVKSIRDSGITTPLFLGGPYPTGDYENVLQDENIDICMLGEGEITVTELVGFMMNNGNQLPSYDILKKMNGIAIREQKEKEKTQLTN